MKRLVITRNGAEEQEYTEEQLANREEYLRKYAEESAILQLEKKEKERLNAYQQESDPLFFKWQAGEVTKQEWLDKRSEIKDRNE
jgi:hypothetical protein